MNSVDKACWIVAFLALVPLSASAQTPDPDYVLSVTDATGAPTDEVVAQVLLDSSAGLDVQGWSYGICNDAADLDVLDAAQGATVLLVKNGSPPDFHVINLLPTGVSVGCVICFTNCASLPPGTDHELLDVTYGLSGPSGTVTALTPCVTLGVPPVQNIIVILGGVGVAPVTEAGAVTIIDDGFVRGDANSDGAVTIVDMIFTLNYLFITGSEVPSCLDGADADDSGAVQLTDAVFIGNFVFVPGSPPIPAPHPNCGTDPTADELDCGSVCP